MSFDRIPGPIRRLREIADMVKRWEDRDLRETGSSTRPLYFVDLIEIAQMFDGTHAQFTAKVKPKGGWPRTTWNTVRDFEIAEFMHEQRQRHDFNHERAVALALKQFPSVGVKSIERADTRFRHIMDSPTDRQVLLMMEVLASSRIARKANPQV